jgi:hypothetical protein
MPGSSERAAGELVDADAVVSRIDDVQQVGFEKQSLRGLAHDLEDELLVRGNARCE